MKAIMRDEREMKDSGIEWIGKIPIEWHLPQVRHYYDIDRGRVIAKTEVESTDLDGYYPVYSSQTKNNGCMGYINTFDYAQEGLTWTTDGANAGTVFYREGYYNCTNVCGILTAKKDNINVKYSSYSIGLSAYNCRREDINGYKIMSNEMAAIHFVCPNSMDEQQTIANYLDDRCSKIDAIIAEAKTSIEEYKELKQAVIYEAVTKGLDKNVEMKDSGVEWIGKIPQHWQIMGFTKCIDEIIDYRGKTPEKQNNGILLITARNIKDGKIDYNVSREYVREEDFDEIMHRGKVNIGDVLFTTEAPLGQVANADRTDFALAQRIIKFSCKRDVMDNYFLK